MTKKLKVDSTIAEELWEEFCKLEEKPLTEEQKILLKYFVLREEIKKIKEGTKTLEELDYVFERRWHTLEKRSKKEKIEMPSKEQLEILLYESFLNGFKCDYCQTQLKIRDSYPYHSVFSFEHKKSIHYGGDSSIENMTIICHRCNITKGPMPEETWRSIIKNLPPDLFNKMCNESFSAGMARELERQGLNRDKQK